MLSSKITHNGPTSGFIEYWIGRLWMRLFGWEVVGHVPVGDKFVLIAAPHTSNWDFPFGLATIYMYRLKVAWIAKDTLFKKPFGGIMRWLGGVAVDRDSPHGVVDQIAQQFTDARKLVIALTPAGTRGRKDFWKSGFYRVAHKARVPILCGYWDYGRRRAGVGLCFVPTGHVKADMDRIRDFYKGVQGKYPELATRARLRNENI